MVTVGAVVAVVPLAPWPAGGRLEVSASTPPVTDPPRTRYFLTGNSAVSWGLRWGQPPAASRPGGTLREAFQRVAEHRGENRRGYLSGNPSLNVDDLIRLDGLTTIVVNRDPHGRAFLTIQHGVLMVLAALLLSRC